MDAEMEGAFKVKVDTPLQSRTKIVASNSNIVQPGCPTHWVVRSYLRCYMTSQRS